jgi:hypothetical protein
MYGEEERDFLLVMKIPATESGDGVPFAPLASYVTYANVINSIFASNDSSLAIVRLEDLPADMAPDSHVLGQKNRIEAAEAMEDATTIASSGDFEGARRRLGATRSRMSDILEHLPTEDRAQQMVYMCELEEAQASVITRDVYYAGGGSKKLSAQSQMHYAQRNNEISAPSAMFSSGDPELQASSRSRAQTYRSLGKMRMMKKAFDLSKK